jgi:DNA-binding HxlR family transcriptional regulator
MMTATTTTTSSTEFQGDDVENVWRILGKKWTRRILSILSVRNAARFSELKKLLSGISGTVLSERLVELEREGLLTRTVHGETVPPKVEYGLTESARELEDILRKLGNWSITDKEPSTDIHGTHAHVY